MCLLVVLFQVVPGAPLVVAANRDERYDRPATAATVLRAGRPRILGGRDEVAGGTWLAVNEHGVVAGLTNRPSPGGRDPTRRSRGELPMAAARHRGAGQAVEALAARIRPHDYNPCWMLVGDRRTLHAVDLSEPDAPLVVPLTAGVHVLENRPPGAPSPKIDRVRALLDRAAPGVTGGVPGGAAGSRGLAHTALAAGTLTGALRAVLVDHQVPGDDPDAPLADDWRPAAVSACCVHTPGYGTRSSSVVVVPEDPGVPPTVEVADGPPCLTPFVDVSGSWSRP